MIQSNHFRHSFQHSIMWRNLLQCNLCIRSSIQLYTGFTTILTNQSCCWKNGYQDVHLLPAVQLLISKTELKSDATNVSLRFNDSARNFTPVNFQIVSIVERCRLTFVIFIVVAVTNSAKNCGYLMSAFVKITVASVAMNLSGLGFELAKSTYVKWKIVWRQRCFH